MKSIHKKFKLTESAYYSHFSYIIKKKIKDVISRIRNITESPVVSNLKSKIESFEAFEDRLAFEKEGHSFFELAFINHALVAAIQQKNDIEILKEGQDSVAWYFDEKIKNDRLYDFESQINQFRQETIEDLDILMKKLNILFKKYKVALYLIEIQRLQNLIQGYHIRIQICKDEISALQNELSALQNENALPLNINQISRP